MAPTNVTIFKNDVQRYKLTKFQKVIFKKNT